MIISDLGRLVLTALLAALVLAGTLQLWSLYLFALLFGCAAGFFLPASSTIVPSILDQDDLPAGNALVQGAAQVAAFLGPLLAGGAIVLIAGSARGSPAMGGIALAFGIDSVTFLVSVVTLWRLGPVGSLGPVASGAGEAGAGAAMIQGFRYAWRDSMLRTVLAAVAVVNLLCAGPQLVGIPVLVDQRLPEGAGALGILLSAYACGNLAGCLLAGGLPWPRRPGLFVSFLLAAFGVTTATVGMLDSTLVLALVLLLLGVGNGYLAILLLTWLQRQTPREILGRMMSLALFANVGLAPISQALAGLLVGWSLMGLFFGAGTGVLVVAALLARSNAFRAVEV